MTSNAPSKCCIAGFRHDGQATGSYTQIGGYECYTTYPATGNTKKAILILTDVLGHKFINAQLIADRFAANGWFCVMPDLFHGMLTSHIGCYDYMGLIISPR
jgi:dienelactone hydrolase